LFSERHLSSQFPQVLFEIVMLANHPTTGGYPVIAVVEPDDLAVVAQAPPGSPIRFRRV
jgi:allophanate hydrolase subunit 2